MEYASEEHARAARALMQEHQKSFEPGMSVDLETDPDRPVFAAKPERIGIGRKGEYGRRLKVINTPDGPREYHVTKGWRN